MVVVVVVVVEFGGVWSGDPSLLSSVPGRPRGAMAEKAGTWVGLKGFGTASEWRGGPHVYVWAG
jgi:hypothetical protein